MSSERKKITDQRVLMSFLKEGLFLQSAVRLFTPGALIEDARISGFVESDIRAKDIPRRLVLRTNSATGEIDSNTPVEIEITLPNLVIRMNTEVYSWQLTEMAVIIPREAWYFQRRSSFRNSYITGTWFPAVITSDKRIFEVSALLKDISRDGFGAIIRVPSGKNTPKPGSAFKGAISSKEAFLPIDSKVIHAKRVGDCPNGFSQYVVGLSPNTSKTSPWDNTNRRKLSRLSILKELILESFIDGRTISVTTREASFSGFSAVLPINHFAYPPGSSFGLRGTTLVFKINSHDEVSRFFLTHGDQECRVRWMNFVIGSHHSDISTSEYQPNELLRLFLEAGALPNELLERASFYSQDFMQTLAETSKDLSWFFRFINRNGVDSALRGHASGVRISDSTWFLGDVAGGTTGDTKISATFIKRFLSAFREFCLTQSPMPHVLGLWKKEHPYWQGFEKFLLENPDIHISQVYLAHEKLSWTDEPIDTADQASFVEITSHDHRTIRSTLKTLAARGVEAFARMLDFAPEHFGSPLLRNLTKASGAQVFERRYFIVSKNNKSSLVVLTRLPLGVSFNQVATSAYIFPLDDKYTEEEWFEIRNCARSLGLAYGCPASSIRRVTAIEDTLYSTESNHVVAQLFYPEAFEYFSEAEKKVA